MGGGEQGWGGSVYSQVNSREEQIGVCLVFAVGVVCLVFVCLSFSLKIYLFTYLRDAHGGQKKMSDPPELGLQRVMSCQVGALSHSVLSPALSKQVLKAYAGPSILLNTAQVFTNSSSPRKSPARWPQHISTL